MTSIELPTPSVRPQYALTAARAAWSVIHRTLLIATAAAVAVLGGLWSSRQAIDTGWPFATTTIDGWRQWQNAGLVSADPYTRAHYLSIGSLPVSSEIGGEFEARTDDSGARLHSSCNYTLAGTAARGVWWSVAVFDDSGRLIPNAASRHAFTSDTTAAKADGSYTVTLGRDARPGNWLPTGGAGRLVVVFTVLDAGARLAADARGTRAAALPVIQRDGCS